MSQKRDRDQATMCACCEKEAAATENCGGEAVCHRCRTDWWCSGCQRNVDSLDVDVNWYGHMVHVECGGPVR